MTVVEFYQMVEYIYIYIFFWYLMYLMEIKKEIK